MAKVKRKKYNWRGKVGCFCEAGKSSEQLKIEMEVPHFLGLNIQDRLVGNVNRFKFLF